MSNSGAPTAREVAELTARLRDLSGRGRSVDPAERAAFLADKEALIARIEAAQQDAPTAEDACRAQLDAWHADDHEGDGSGWSR